MLPKDIVCAESLDAQRSCGTLLVSAGGASASCVPKDAYGVDIGPKTCSAFAAALKGCGTIFWNGPLGVAELDAFSSGTEEVAYAVGQAARDGTETVVGGATLRVAAAHTV